jgi:hypothetical protein
LSRIFKWHYLKKDINLEDAIDISEIKNIKLANQLLKVKRKAKQEREEKMKLCKLRLCSCTATYAISTNGCSNMAMQKIQAETQAKMQLSKQK